jgi:type IV secretory pathway VirB4 component
MADSQTPKQVKIAAKRTAKVQAATQTYLDISEIKDGVVVLRDNSLRSVLRASSINFELKNEAEKDAVIYGYQSFLNSLNFPLQILIKSRKINLDPYLDHLDQLAQDQSNELLQNQTVEYAGFIRQLIDIANIMDKQFYVVVPFYPSGVQKVGFLKKVMGTGNAYTEHVGNFDSNKEQLKQRTSLVAQGLGAIGVRAAELQTQELVELYYASYNPETQQQQKLAPVEQLDSPLIVGAPNEKALNESMKPSPNDIAKAPTSIEMGGNNGV